MPKPLEQSSAISCAQNSASAAADAYSVDVVSARVSMIGGNWRTVEITTGRGVETTVLSADLTGASVGATSTLVDSENSCRVGRGSGPSNHATAKVPVTCAVVIVAASMAVRMSAAEPPLVNWSARLR